MKHNKQILLIYIIYFFSGICSLIDEVVWVRLLKLVIGNTVYASSIVVSVFLGGLALGAFLMSKKADTIQKPLHVYALLELLITISALCIPLALQGADLIYIWIYRLFSLSQTGLIPFQIFISAFILLIPTVLMGSSLPLLGRVVARLKSNTGPLVGKLYAINTFGAALGTFLAGFFLIRIFGVMGALYFAAVLNLCVALAAWGLARTEQGGGTVPEEDQVSESIKPVSRILLAGVFISGFVSIGYEIVWIRSIIPLLGADTYVFSAVLTMYLVGNVIGAWIGSRLAKTVKHTGIGFGITTILLGVAGIMYIPILVMNPQRIIPGLGSILQWVYTSYPGLIFIIHPMINSIILFLVPSIIMGIGFPLALQAVSRFSEGTGNATGVVYSINTAGAVAGGILTGFLLLPLLGVQTGILVLSAAGMFMGAAVIIKLDESPRRRFVIGMASLAYFILVACAIPQNLFTRTLIRLQDSDLVDVEEGITTIASVHREENGYLWLCTSGMQVGGDRARGVQRMLGHLGIFLHQDPKNVLSVGFGTGETTACLAMHDLESIDCVEISPEVAAMSLKHFTHLNLGKELHEKVNMIFMDAKNYLHLTDKTYDVIVTDSINPKYFSENASLYTKEYFQSAKDHLNPDGLVICWVPFTVPPSCFGSIARTFSDVFAHTTLWFLPTGHDHFVLLAGSTSKQKYSLARIRKRLAEPDIKEHFAEIEINSALDLMSCYVCDQGQLAEAVGMSPINSDMDPFVEFSTDTGVAGIQKWEFIINLFNKIRRPDVVSYIKWKGISPEEKKEWEKDFKLLYRITSHILGLYVSAGIKTNLFPKPEAGADEQFFVILSSYLEKHPEYIAGRNFRGVLYMKKDENDKAVDDFTSVIKKDPRNTFAFFNRGKVYFQKKQYTRALKDFSRALEQNPQNLMIVVARGQVLLNQGNYVEALKDFSKAIKNNRMFAQAYFFRGITFTLLERYGYAFKDFSRVILLSPRDADAYARRAHVLFRLDYPEKAWEDVKTCESLGGSVDDSLKKAVEKLLKKE
ncbi:fused MFS/spermidine synthase [Planctomycetota bacterium]